MTTTDDLAPGLAIICADGLLHAHLEAVEGDYLITTVLDDGQRHYIPLNVVEHVDDGVYLSVTQEELLQLL